MYSPLHCHYYRDVLWVCWVLIFCTFISSLHIIAKDGKMETGLVMVRIILCSSYNLISCLCRSLIFHIKLFKWIHFIPHRALQFFFFHHLFDTWLQYNLNYIPIQFSPQGNIRLQLWNVSIWEIVFWYQLKCEGERMACAIREGIQKN